MTTDRLLEIVAWRKLEVVLDDDNQPAIKGPRTMITPELVTVLKIHREEIVRRLIEERGKNMTPQERAQRILKIIADRGLTLERGQGDVLTLLGPDEEKTSKLVAAVEAFREELLALIPAPDVTPADEPVEPDDPPPPPRILVPAGAILFCQTESRPGKPMRVCNAWDKDLYMWTYSGAKEWFYCHIHGKPEREPLAQKEGAPS